MDLGSWLKEMQFAYPSPALILDDDSSPVLMMIVCHGHGLTTAPTPQGQLCVRGVLCLFWARRILGALVCQRRLISGFMGACSDMRTTFQGQLCVRGVLVTLMGMKHLKCSPSGQCTAWRDAWLRMIVGNPLSKYNAVFMCVLRLDQDPEKYPVSHIYDVRTQASSSRTHLKQVQADLNEQQEIRLRVRRSCMCDAEKTLRITMLVMTSVVTCRETPKIGFHLLRAPSCDIKQMQQGKLNAPQILRGRKVRFR